jgi:hypothetical protein
MRAQLQYWRKEYAAASAQHDADRLSECERFIRQCEDVIAALVTAERSTPMSH